MADVVNPQVVDEITINKVQTIGGFPAAVANAQASHMQAASARRDNAADANAQIMSGLATAAYGESIGPRAGPGNAEQAMSATEPSALLAALVKLLGNTPPVTVTGKIPADPN